MGVGLRMCECIDALLGSVCMFHLTRVGELSLMLMHVHPSPSCCVPTASSSSIM